MALLYACQMAILLRNCARQSRRQPLVFLAVLLDRAPRNEVLQFLVCPQPQHLLATASRIPGTKIFVNDIEKLLKLEGRTAGEDSNQLLSYQIRNATGECIFL